jgi:hypothetical protein
MFVLDDYRANEEAPKRLNDDLNIRDRDDVVQIRENVWGVPDWSLLGAL